MPMPTEYFSDRENGPRARIEEVINHAVWGGIAACVQSLMADGSFGFTFPDTCLDLAAGEPEFREVLETEAKAMTAIGNRFLIRHTETSQTRIERDSQVDYLFHRLFSLLDLLLKERTKRGAAVA